MLAFNDSHNSHPPSPGVIAASTPPKQREQTKLLVDDGNQLTLSSSARLATHLRAGDLVVVNDAAALPASLSSGVVVRRDVRSIGAECELRLAARTHRPTVWWAVAMGTGSWRDDTDQRPPPPRVSTGDRVVFDGGSAEVLEVDGRLWKVRFDVHGGNSGFWRWLYRHGRPVQYSHLERDLELWDVQTVYAARPWAVEMPSAGRALTWAGLQSLRDGGVQVISVTHGAGLSATGDPQLDRRLPFPEWTDISGIAADAVTACQARGGRVIAVGTSVARALEGRYADTGRVGAGESVTAHRIDAEHPPQVVDALLLGVHSPGESHFDLLEGFVGAQRASALDRAANEHGLRTHEFGDQCLVFRPSLD